MGPKQKRREQSEERPDADRGVQLTVQFQMQKGCETHFQASHPWRIHARDYVNLVKAALYGRAPKASALPGCATPRCVGPTIT